MRAIRSVPKVALSTALYAAFAALLCAQFLICAGSFSSDSIINDDYRQNLFWAPSLVSPDLFSRDLLAQYSRGFNPAGLEMIYGLALGAGLSGPTFSKILSVALFFTFLAGAGALAGRLAGRRASLTVPLLLIFILLNNKYYFRFCMGGLARNFAFPLQAWMAYALLSRNAGLALLVTVISSFFHPQTFLLCWVSLVAWQSLEAARALRHGLSLSRVVPRLALTLALGTAAATPLLIDAMEMSKRFGPIVTGAEIATMTEFQPRGRWWQEKPLGLTLSLLEEARADNEIHRRGLHGVDWRTAMAILLYGSFLFWAVWLYLRRRRTFWLWSPLLLSGLCAAALFTAGELLMARLYFPNRFLRPMVPLLVTALVCERIAAGVPPGWSRRRRIAWGVWAAVLIIGTTRFFSAENDVGYPVDAAALVPVADRVRDLPADTLIAAFPKEDADNLSTFGERSVFIQREISHPLYHRFLDEVRRRTFLCLAGLFPVRGDEEMAKLAREGVDYILVNKKILERLAHEGKIPEYDEPYRTWLTRRLSPGAARAIERHWIVRMRPFVVYEDPGYMLIRISDFQRTSLAAQTGSSPILLQ